MENSDYQHQVLQHKQIIICFNISKSYISHSKTIISLGFCSNNVKTTRRNLWATFQQCRVVSDMLKNFYYLYIFFRVSQEKKSLKFLLCKSWEILMVREVWQDDVRMLWLEWEVEVKWGFEWSQVKWVSKVQVFSYSWKYHLHWTIQQCWQSYWENNSGDCHAMIKVVAEEGGEVTSSKRRIMLTRKKGARQMKHLTSSPALIDISSPADALSRCQMNIQWRKKKAWQYDINGWEGPVTVMSTTSASNRSN